VGDYLMTSDAILDVARVAVIDDDRSVREATTALLSSLDYSVVSFASAEEFLSSNVAQFHCIITDMMMPGMGGQELQEKLVSDGHQIPVIFMAASPEKTIADPRCVETKCGFLRKPFREESLIACLKKALNGSFAKHDLPSAGR
jgi:FixJ family two-component response regulator